MPLSPAIAIGFTAGMKSEPGAAGTAVSSLLPTRVSLVAGLRDPADGRSWEYFRAHYWGLLVGYAKSRGLGPHEAEEVAQETLIAVSRNIGSYEYQPGKSSFKAWLRGIVRHKVADQWRKRARQPDTTSLGDGTDHCAAPDDAPDEVWERQWQMDLVAAAVEKVRFSVSADQFRLWHECTVRCVPAREVAKTFGVSAACVHVAAFRIRARITREARAMEKAMEKAAQVQKAAAATAMR